MQVALNLDFEPIHARISYLDLRMLFALVMRGRESVRAYYDFRQFLVPGTWSMSYRKGRPVAAALGSGEPWVRASPDRSWAPWRVVTALSFR